MKQVVVKSGKPLVVDVPAPALLPGFLLVEVRASCVSPGTEMAGIAASGKSLLQRAMEQPDKAKAALLKMKDQGVSAVWRQAKRQFDREGLAGYSAAGVVVDVGPGAEGFTRGMGVAVAGAGMANHAEVVSVPVNLAVPIPEGVDFDAASSVALGGIAMQGVRRAEVALGERVAVIGCGPLGLLAVQMLQASGCRVFATDLDERRLAMAGEFGAECTANPSTEDIVKRALHWSGGQGVDAAIVFTATSSGEPVSQAFQMSRRKGRVVLVGVAGGEYERDEMYTKELDFVISTSYGPGRYDEDYELRGRDYPYAYVRWTEKRNMEAYLELLRRGVVRVDPLIEVREPLSNAPAAYERLKSPQRPLLAVIQYEERTQEPSPIQGRVEAVGVWHTPASGAPVALALVGAGSFVQAMHVPVIKGMAGKVSVPWACSRTGTSARACAALLPGCQPTTEYDVVLADPAVHAVLIGTRHDTHADLAIRALKAGKAVFLEKPMCLTPAEFESVQAAVRESAAPFVVGYNRRFSPFADIVRREVSRRIHPLMIHYTMNAGYLPPTHWTQGPEGGGRLLGEACHIIDLFRSLVGQPVREVSCSPLRSPSAAALPTDNFTLSLTYGDGSVATLLYTAQGHKAVPKERMEVYFDEKAFILDDYLAMEAHGMSKAGLALKQRDKGHAAELAAFHRAVATGERFPIPWEELVETWQVTWQADQICRSGEAL
ncbi:MAG: bi-domain-containing oxidoreductase [Verrucomicrobia bacterium]|jgi:predicted dehydrogenase/threonine dehydrogenase-like Zn-dependent dehydrogenase|nr:bi-domain-containing oxidoreductase [Verrucomicrobiota bacterium]